MKKVCVVCGREYKPKINNHANCTCSRKCYYRLYNREHPHRRKTKISKGTSEYIESEPLTENHLKPFDLRVGDKVKIDYEFPYQGKFEVTAIYPFQFIVNNGRFKVGITKSAYQIGEMAKC